MSGLHKRILIDKLRPGMYIEDVFNDTGVLLYSANTLVNGFHQIEILRRQGVFSVYISLQKGTDAEEGSELEPFPENISETDSTFHVYSPEQLKKTANLHKRTIDIVKDTMQAARTGRMFSISLLVQVVEEMVEGILEDPDVHLALCHLKSYSSRIYVHSVNVAVVGTGLAGAMGYKKNQIIEAGVGLLLHDIGKVKIPEKLLAKGGMYTHQELEYIRKHPLFGIEIVDRKGFNIPEIARTIISQHHERWNGGGFPHGLKGNKIDELAIICAISDMYDNLTTGDIYRRACLPQEALALIFQGSDEEYPRKIVELFTKLLGIYPVGSFVKLETGEMGLVTRINRQTLLFPHVLVLFDSNGGKVETPYSKNLAETLKTQIPCKIECSLDPKTFRVNPEFYMSPPELLTV
jgi:HD-GYP domain-containing protein (c-di-GMP phosphodiesterase class II)